MRGYKSHFAPQPLGWCRCVGFRCLHRTVKGLQSDRRIPAVDALLGSIGLFAAGGSASILERRCNRCSWLVLVWGSGGIDAAMDGFTVGPVALVTGALPISLAWHSVQRCRWHVVHV